MENPNTPSKRPPLKRGLFRNGIWHCDCDQRLPADKFRVKNGGKNHGRWFYTCQRPQPKRCGFFMWSDDAQVREQSAVLHNSRSEPVNQAPPQPPQSLHQTPQTPRKQQKIGPLMTPNSKPSASEHAGTKRKPIEVDVEADEDFGWSSSADEELAEVAENFTDQEQHPTTGSVTSPRKAAKTARFDSPSKHVVYDKQVNHEEDSDDETVCELKDNDVFTTPSTSTKTEAQRNSTLLPSPFETPASMQHHHQQQQRTQPRQDFTHSSLASEALDILSPIKSSIPSSTERELVDLLNRHELRTQGIAKGREITRVAVQAKEKRIAELQARITGLEAEKETSRAVIAHLKQDMATSPKKPRWTGRPEQNSRSEV